MSESSSSSSSSSSSLSSSKYLTKDWVQARVLNLKASYLCGEEIDFDYALNPNEVISSDEEDEDDMDYDTSTTKNSALLIV